MDRKLVHLGNNLRINDILDIIKQYTSDTKINLCDTFEKQAYRELTSNEIAEIELGIRNYKLIEDWFEGS